MKKILAPLLLSILLLVGCSDQKANRQNECPGIEIKFSPRGGVTQSIVDGINEAKHTIRIQAFSFTSQPIADAIIEAHKRGVVVEAVLDRENLGNKSSVMKLLHANNIEIYIDSRHAIAHNKLIIIDEHKVYTGSFNFTKSAEEHNAENSIAITDNKIAEMYIENWNLHKEHSKLYVEQ